VGHVTMRVARPLGDMDIVPGAHLDPLRRAAVQRQDLLGAREHEEDLGGIMTVQGNDNPRRDHSPHHAKIVVRGCGRGRKLHGRSEDIRAILEVPSTTWWMTSPGFVCGSMSCLSFGVFLARGIGTERLNWPGRPGLGPVGS